MSEIYLFLVQDKGLMFLLKSTLTLITAVIKAVEGILK